MYKGYPQPFRTWLLILTALIFAVIIVQFVASVSWLFVVVLALALMPGPPAGERCV